MQHCADVEYLPALPDSSDPQGRVPSHTWGPPPEEVVPIWKGALGSWRIRVDREPLDSQALKRLYDRRARDWDRVLERLGFRKAYTLLMRSLVSGGSLEQLSPGARVLDCGIGTGAFGAALASVAPAVARVDGVDLSPAMLAAAGKRLESLGVRGQLRVADVRALPFADGVYDAVLAAHVVEHLPEPGRALAEMLRVLRPGGVLVVALTREGPLGRLVQWRWRVRCLTKASLRALLPPEIGTPVFIRIPRQFWFQRMSLVALIRRPGRDSFSRPQPRVAHGSLHTC